VGKLRLGLNGRMYEFASGYIPLALWEPGERERARMEREEGETRLDRGNRSQGKLCGQGGQLLDH